MGGMSTLWDRSMGWRPVRALVDRSVRRQLQRRVAELSRLDPVREQARTLRGLIGKARRTRFGRDHGFDRIDGVAAFQAAVPIRTYESLWKEYLADRYPVFDDLTWPGRIPYLAMTSGTTQGASRYIPVSREMAASNRKAAVTMLAYLYAANLGCRLFRGRLFLLGGSANLARVAPGVEEGDLSGIAARDLSPVLRPFTFPPLELALESDWDRKLSSLAELSRHEPISLVGGVPSWLLTLSIGCWPRRANHR
jgi:GH3 auxin-responsive promoter